MTLDIRVVDSPVDRQKVFSLRYRIYVEEMGVAQRYADHVHHLIEEPQDKSALILAAFDGPTVVGTVRINLGCRGSLNEYRVMHRLDLFARFEPDRVSVSTKFMLAEPYRNGKHYKALLRASFQQFLDHGIEFDFGTCRPGSSAWVVRAGYRQIFPETSHPEDGKHIPLILVVRDKDYLTSTGSPLADLVSVKSVESVEFFHTRFPTPLRAATRRHLFTGDSTMPSNQPDPELSESARELIAGLDRKIDDLCEGFTASPFVSAISKAPLDPKLPRLLMRELFLDVSSYHRDVFEAAATAIGRLPKSKPALIKLMFEHLADEAEHGEWAFKDYLKFGGDPAARQLPKRPAAFAIASLWWGLARLADPPAFIGAMYLFEASTPRLCDTLTRLLRQAGFGDDELTYLLIHGKIDVNHAKVIRRAIGLAVDANPDAAKSIEYGFDCFRAIYPTPLFESVLGRL